MEKKTIDLYVSLVAVMQLMFGLHASVYVIFLLQNSLTLFQVSLVNLCFMLGVFIFEIPTGAVADIMGRKFSFVLSNVICGIGFIYYSVGDNFVQFIIAEIIIAIGVTLTSGALRAWLVDSLHHYGWHGSLVDVFRREGRVSNIALLIGGIVGAYLGKADLSRPFLVVGICSLALALYVWIVMKEEYWIDREKNEESFFHNMKKVASESIAYGLKHQAIFVVIISTVTMVFTWQAYNMYWQPWFRPDLPGNEYLGYIWAGVVIFTVIGNELVAWFTKRFKRIKYGYLVIGESAAFLIILSVVCSNFWVSLMFFWTHELFRGIFRPYTNAVIQENAPSHTRATVDSFVSMMQKGAAALGLLIFGFLADMWGIGFSWIIASLFVVVALPFVLLFNNKKNPSP